MTLLVADSGPLIALARLGLLHLPARIYRDVLVTETVWDEVTRSPRRAEHDALEQARGAGWLVVAPDPEDAAFVLPDPRLDDGEVAAIALAAEHGATLLIDEQRGRLAATAAGLQVVGTLGLLLLAKEVGEVGALRPLVGALRSSGYFLSEALTAYVLNRSGE